MSQYTNDLSAEEQIKLFPTTRYMGSKSKLIDHIWAASSRFEFESVLDLFSGSGVVSYMYKSHGKRVVSNDYMTMGAVITKALIENNSVILNEDEALELLVDHHDSDSFVETKFKGLYFSDEDNHFIDVLRANIKKIENPYKKAIAMQALIRACTKKRPRGIFTYVGNRYDDGRKDLTKSFEEQFLDAVKQINGAVFSNKKKNRSCNEDSMNIKANVDLVYIDPPYYTPKSDNEYVRRYHFVEGLARDWEGVDIQEETKTKKFKSYPTPFSKKDGAYEAFDNLFSKYRRSILVVSYSSNSLPTMDEMTELLKKYKDNVEVVPVDYKYSFGTRSNTLRNDVKEYIFLGW